MKFVLVNFNKKGCRLITTEAAPFFHLKNIQMDEIQKILLEVIDVIVQRREYQTEYTVCLRSPLWHEFQKSIRSQPGLIIGQQFPLTMDKISIHNCGITFNFVEQVWEEYKTFLLRQQQQARFFGVEIEPEPAAKIQDDSVSGYLTKAFENLYFPVGDNWLQEEQEAALKNVKENMVNMILHGTPTKKL